MEANRTRGGRPEIQEPGTPEGVPRTARHNGHIKSAHWRCAPVPNRATTPEPLILQRQGNGGPTRRRRQAACSLWRRCGRFPRGAVGLFGFTGVCQAPIKNPAGAGLMYETCASVSVLLVQYRHSKGLMTPLLYAFFGPPANCAELPLIDQSRLGWVRHQEDAIRFWPALGYTAQPEARWRGELDAHSTREKVLAQLSRFGTRLTL